jgi:hypothetical protein
VNRSLIVLFSAAALAFSLGHLFHHYLRLTESYSRLLVF